jgi:YHS domain-containing protein
MLSLLAVGWLWLPSASADEEVNLVNGFAVHGYDVVAYFTVGEPTQGSDDYTVEYEGATYRFANAANRDTFVADPARYAPQYGGYCAVGTAMGRKFDGDPQLWSIIDDKLYLNVNRTVQNLWVEDPAAFIRGADHNWPIIAAYRDAALESNPPEGLTLGKQ